MKVFVFIVLSLSIGVAQNVQTFYASDLAVVPGLIEVTPGFPATIELYDQIDIILSGDDNETFLLEDLGDQLSIKTAASSGSMGVKLMVRGRRLMFEVQVNADEPMTRVYPVLQDRGRAYAPNAEVSFPVAQAQPVAQIPETVTAAPSSDQAPDSQLQLRPAGIDAQGNLTVFFTFQNGSERVALDPTRLEVIQNGLPLVVQTTKEPISNLLSPQETQNGFLKVSGVTPGQVGINWEVVTLSDRGGERSTIREVVDAR